MKNINSARLIQTAIDWNEQKEVLIKENKISEISKELRDIIRHQAQWRKTLRARFEQGNGLPWVQYLRNHFDTEKVFSDIKKDSKLWDIARILEKRGV